jgi:hypothetical protein
LVVRGIEIRDGVRAKIWCKNKCVGCFSTGERVSRASNQHRRALPSDKYIVPCAAVQHAVMHFCAIDRDARGSADIGLVWRRNNNCQSSFRVAPNRVLGRVVERIDANTISG